MTDHWHRQLSCLLSATLETWVHALLYLRRVYPLESFGLTRFLGIPCHIHRHPAVNSYIQDSIAMSVSTILSGAVNEVVLAIVIDEANSSIERNGNAEVVATTTMVQQRELEKYSLRWADLNMNWIEQGDVARKLQLIEKVMRNLILKVHSMEQSTCTTLDSVSFIIRLHYSDKQSTCLDLQAALSNGSWMALGDGAATGDFKTKQSSNGDLIRPLHRASCRLFTVDFSMKRPAPDI